MIHYPYNYFEEETRCGFRITSLMKKCWAAQLQVLEDIDLVCKKYNLQYCAAYGTLLGAVRHKGYIPWDDDMDIWMKRKDYMVLMGVLEKELPEYELLSIYNDPQWGNTFSRVINTRTLPIRGERRSKFYDFPLGIGVDIFPIDCIPKNEELQYTQRALLNLAWRMIKNLWLSEKETCTESDKEIIKNELAESIKVFAEFCSIPKMEGKTAIQVMQLIFDQLCMIGIEENSDYYAYMSTLYEQGYKVQLKKEWFENTIEMPYEYGKIRVPIGYEYVLRAQYGNSFMKYVVNGAGHNYPYFLAQLKQLKEANLLDIETDPKDEGIPDEIKPIEGSASLVSDEIKKRVDDAKSEKKQVVLLQPMQTSMLAYEERYIKVIGKMIEQFINDPESLVWFRPHLNEHVPYADVKPELFDAYKNMCNKYADSLDLIYDISDNQMGAIELCDVYVGQESYLSDEFDSRNKDCYIIDFNIDDEDY